MKKVRKEKVERKVVMKRVTLALSPQITPPGVF